MDEETRLIHDRGPPGPPTRTVGPAIERGSTVLMPSAAALYDGSLSYGRQGLASQTALRQSLAALEGGCDAFLFPSGLAAVTGTLSAVLRAGNEILCADSVYLPTRRFCATTLARFGVTTRYFAPTLSADQVMALASPATRLIILESPGSLTFEMQDVPAIAAVARARNIFTLIDNTWAAGLTFKPLAHGVDFSVQALTKYVGGQSDLFMGSCAVADPGLAKLMAASEVAFGWSVAPEAAYQMWGGLRTLATRMARHGASGIEVATWLAAQPQVRRVLHPALPGDPGHAIWTRDYTGACGLFGAVLQPAPLSAVEAFLDRLKLFGLGFSWGGFESLALHCGPQLDMRAAKPDFEGPVVRLHVGLESPADLIADLAEGLKAFDAAR